MEEQSRYVPSSGLFDPRAQRRAAGLAAMRGGARDAATGRLPRVVQRCDADSGKTACGGSGHAK
ncbi:hypothetical protein BLAT2472_50442 [Burkholderia latens]